MSSGDPHDLGDSSAMLKCYMNTNIVYSRKPASSYNPSCLMMDYVVHLMNKHLVDNYYFKRVTPDYHPYILRLYYGVLFWIQCLRAGLEADTLTCEQEEFLMHFLDHHPPESLPVAAPLLPHFKTLCTSKPQTMMNNYGLVYPSIPSPAGPERRDSFMRGSTCTSGNNSAFFLPNIPGIIALLEDLNLLINGDPQVVPSMGKHIPVQETGNQTKVFGYYSFPPLEERSDFEKYVLCSPGLQYTCEADKNLNKSFADSYNNFDFPITRANDNLRPIANFLHMNNSKVWFTQVKAVAAIAAKYFKGSGTLADCAPHGVTANQYVCVMQPPATKMISTPRHSADKRALFPFALRLTTTVTNPNPHTESMAALAQTHIQMFTSHPYLSQFGQPVGSGPFWAFRPIEKSGVDNSSYISLSSYVKELMKYKE